MWPQIGTNGTPRARSYMFSVQIPDAFVLYAFRLRDQWIVLGTIAFRFVIGTIHGLRSLTSMHYTAQRENSLVGMIDRLTLGHNARSPQLCTKPRPLEHVLGTTAFRLRFGGVLRGWFVPRTWFDHVPAGTVLAGTVPARTRSDYKKWCVPRTCSENMFPLELYREQMWTPGQTPGVVIGGGYVPSFFYLVSILCLYYRASLSQPRAMEVQLQTW